MDIPTRIADDVPFEVGFRLADAQLAFRTILDKSEICPALVWFESLTFVSSSFRASNQSLTLHRVSYMTSSLKIASI